MLYNFLEAAGGEMTFNLARPAGEDVPKTISLTEEQLSAATTAAGKDVSALDPYDPDFLDVSEAAGVDEAKISVRSVALALGSP